jgi:hypothetical protein
VSDRFPQLSPSPWLRGSWLRTFAGASCQNTTGLGGALFVVRPPPLGQGGLELAQPQINLVAERNAVELLADGWVEAVDDAVGWRTLPLGPPRVKVLPRLGQLRGRGSRTATVLRPPLRQPAAQPHCRGLTEGHALVGEQVRCRQGRLALGARGKGPFALGVDDGLRGAAPSAFARADGEGVVRSTLPRTCTLTLAVGFLLPLGLLEGRRSRLGSALPLLGPLGL